MAGTYKRKPHDIVSSCVDRLSARSSFVARSLEIVGHVASLASWQKERRLTPARRYFGREAMWATIFPRLQSGPVIVLEFGVSRGAATRFWLARIPNTELRWHGFDTFTGLPEPWTRGGVEFAAKGEFDAGGTPPDISDPRIVWHIGLVEDTLPKLSIDDDARLCVLFDLDLYEPSAFALEWLSNGCLHRGDLLYFDEAYDPAHERRLLDEFIRAGHRMTALGSTGVALMFEYEGCSVPSGAPAPVDAHQE